MQILLAGTNLCLVSIGLGFTPNEVAQSKNMAIGDWLKARIVGQIHFGYLTTSNFMTSIIRMSPSILNFAVIFTF